MRRRVAEAVTRLRAVFQNPGLRRLQLAWAGSTLGQFFYMVGLAVYAFDEGGAAAVGVLSFVRLGSATLASPFLALLGDRRSRPAVMAGSDLVRAAALTVAGACVLAGGPALVVYAMATVASIASEAFHPAQAAVIPQLTDDPEQLTAANATSGLIMNVGSLLGPAAGGLVYAATSAGAVFLITAAFCLWSAWNVVAMGRFLRTRASTPAPAAAPAEAAPERILPAALEGFRTIGRDAGLRAVVGLYSGGALVWGLLTVFIPVLALDELDLGDAGVGYLIAVTGIGGLIGGVAAAGLLGGRRLATAVGAGAIVWGAPVALIGAALDLPVALIALGVIGIGEAFMDVGALTLLQRSVPEEVLARVFGVVGCTTVGAMAIGGLVAPVLLDALGIRGALAATGLLLPVLAALSWRRLAAVDRAAAVPGPELELLQRSPIFAPLPLAAQETLALRLHPLTLRPGSQAVRQGDPAEHFFLVRDGALDVHVDGRPARVLGPGDVFGEIALLRDSPRTATVTARSESTLLRLDRADFLAAVDQSAASADAAHTLVARRLGLRAEPGLA